MKDFKKAAQKIEIAIQRIDAEVLCSNKNMILFTTAEQLERFKEALTAALEKVINHNIPEKAYRDLGLARIITDQWPYDSDLGIKIIEAEQAYKNL